MRIAPRAIGAFLIFRVPGQASPGVKLVLCLTPCSVLDLRKSLLRCPPLGAKGGCGLWRRRIACRDPWPELRGRHCKDAVSCV